MIYDNRFVPFDKRTPVEEEFEDFSEEIFLHKKFMRRKGGQRIFAAS